MLLKSTITLLLATLAAAVPSKRQAKPTIGIYLANDLLAVWEQVKVTTDGPAVVINTTIPFERVGVKCLEACDQSEPFYCVLLDNGPPFAVTLLQRTTSTYIRPARTGGSIRCATGLPDPGPPVWNIGSYLRVKLTNTILNVTEDFEAAGNGTAVAIDPTYAFDHATLECVGECFLEYHCKILDENLSSVVTLHPGNTEINPAKQGSSITCGEGRPSPQLIPPEQKLPPPAAKRFPNETTIRIRPLVPLAPKEGFRVPINGTAVNYEIPWAFRDALLECMGACHQEFHCTLYNTEYQSAPKILRLGKNNVDPPQRLGYFTCKLGPPEVKPAAMEARATELTIRVVFNSAWENFNSVYNNEREQIDVPTNGTAVAVNPASGLNSVFVECIKGTCLPQYHCILHDRSQALFTNLHPGWNGIIRFGQKGGSIKCKPGPPEVEPAAIEARATEPQDRASVFTDNGAD